MQEVKRQQAEHTIEHQRAQIQAMEAERHAMAVEMAELRQRLEHSEAEAKQISITLDNVQKERDNEQEAAPQDFKPATETDEEGLGIPEDHCKGATAQTDDECDDLALEFEQKSHKLDAFHRLQKLGEKSAKLQAFQRLRNFVVVRCLCRLIGLLDPRSAEVAQGLMSSMHVVNLSCHACSVAWDGGKMCMTCACSCHSVNKRSKTETTILGKNWSSILHASEMAVRLCLTQLVEVHNDHCSSADNGLECSVLKIANVMIHWNKKRYTVGCRLGCQHKTCLSCINAVSAALSTL